MAEYPGLCLPQTQNLDRVSSYNSIDSKNEKKCSEIVKRRPLFSRSRIYQIRSFPRLSKVDSKGAILVLVWSFLTILCISAIYGVIISRLASHIQFLEDRPMWKITIINVVKAVLEIAYPIAGWIADSYLGRYKVIHRSMQIIWLGAVITTIVLAIDYYRVNSLTAIKVMTYGVYPVIFVLVSIGVAGYHTNAIPFGVDQMQGFPEEQFTAFVRWYVWTENFGYGFVFVMVVGCGKEKALPYLIYLAVTSAGMSVAIVLDYALSRGLIIEPPGGSPFRAIYNVLNYIRKDRSRERDQRSALTYWENKKYSRFDLAKRRYGGPYTSDYVEGVRATLHMLVVLLSILLTSFVYGGMDAFSAPLIDHFNTGLHNGTHKISTRLCYSESAVDNASSIVFIIAHPLTYFILYPIIAACFPTSLKRVGLGMIVLLFSSISMFSLDLVSHLTSANTHVCFLATNNSDASSGQLTISYQWLLIPNVLIGIAILFQYTATFEFIVAQAQHNAQGFLIGIRYFLIGIGRALGVIILLAFYLAYRNMRTPPKGCDTWYFLVNLVLVVAGFVIFSVVSRWYKPRLRDDISYNQTQFEQHYDRVLSPDHDITTSD